MKIKPYLIRIIISGIVLGLSIFAICGAFYPVQIFDFQFVPLIQRLVFNFSVIALVLFLTLVVLTFAFGRIYCSMVCPFGILQEVFAFLRGKKKNKKEKNYWYKYLISGLSLGVLLGGTSILIRYFDPYTIFTSTLSLSFVGVITAIFVLVLVFFKNRFFCSNICPVGTILGFISKVSLNKIYIDENCAKCGACLSSCPVGAIDYNEGQVENETCVKCLKCVSVCPKKAIKYGIKKPKFNPKRRDFVKSIGLLAFVGAGYYAGLNLVKSAATKFKNIILPAGAINQERMINKCLNCNLCVENCPNGILTKGDSQFPVVHIDYKKGKRYCGYGCHNCSNICPTGAIKKLTLEEKQNTKIAIASVKDNCKGCRACVNVCPKGAISIERKEDEFIGHAKIDSTKCIGCGKCANVCRPRAIEIFAVNEQSNI